MRTHSRFLVLPLLAGLSLSQPATSAQAAPDAAKKGAPTAGATWVQLSSKASQRPTTTAPSIATLESDDGMAGMAHDPAKPSEVVIKTPGVYFVIAAGQIGKTSGAGVDYVDMWVRKNGKDIDNTNTRKSIAEVTGTAVLVSQGLIELKAGDALSVAFAVSAADRGLGLIATSPKNEPIIPSLILSMFKVK